MDAQQLMFTPTTTGRLALAIVPHNRTPGSIEAARKISRKCKGERGRILAMLAESPWNLHGATQQQISDELKLDRSNVSGRCNGLENDGLIYIRGKRKTRANVNAAVYSVLENGEAELTYRMGGGHAK